jgi:hypothetical protein
MKLLLNETARQLKDATCFLRVRFRAQFCGLSLQDGGQALQGKYGLPGCFPHAQPTYMSGLSFSESGLPKYPTLKYEIYVAQRIQQRSFLWSVVRKARLQSLSRQRMPLQQLQTSARQYGAFNRFH